MTTPADSLRERVIAMAQARSSDPCQYAREGTLALAVAAMVAEECAKVIESEPVPAAAFGLRKAWVAAIRRRAEGL